MLGRNVLDDKLGRLEQFLTLFTSVFARFFLLDERSSEFVGFTVGQRIRTSATLLLTLPGSFLQTPGDLAPDPAQISASNPMSPPISHLPSFAILLALYLDDW